MKPQNRPSPERLLMTGASGLLGSALVPEAHQRGYAVTAVTHTFAGVFPYGESRKCDISRYDTLSPFLDSMNPSLILHCAALTDVDFCEMNPDRANAINREATSRLAQWAGQHNSYFVYISTDSVFDGKHGSYAENDVPRPLNWYARTKWEGEQAVRTHTPRHLIVRTNLYGWSLGPRLSLAEWLLRGMLQNDTIKTFNDVRFNPLFTKDLALILFDAIDQRPIGTFHLGSRDTCSKHEFALLISQIFHIPAHLTPISVEEFPFKAPRPKNTTLSVEKISGFLKHQMPEVADGIRAFRAFLGQGEVSLENKEWLAKLPMEHR